MFPMDYSEIKILSEKYADYTAENLSKLIKIKSLSAKEEAVQKELMKQMEEAGFDEVKMDGLGNVIGRIGNGKKILAFDGHMDTVDMGNMNNWNFDETHFSLTFFMIGRNLSRSALI